MHACTKGTAASHDNRRAGRGRGVQHRRNQILPPIKPLHVVTPPGAGIHQQLSGVARVSPLPIDPSARRADLHRRPGVPLEVAVPERVGDRAGQQRGNVYDHAISPNVGVRGHEGRPLRPVHRLVERPCALAGALACRIPHPDVGGRAGAGERAMRTAGAHAEALHRHVLRC